MNKKPLLVYVSPKTSQIKEFRLSIPKILAGAGVLLLLTVFILKYSVDFIIDFSQNSKIFTLEEENSALVVELDLISQKINALRTNIDHLEERDDKIRALLDLPAIDEDIRQVGIGGREDDLLESNNLGQFSFGDELESNLATLEKLEREIRLETESYQQLLATVERSQDSIRYLPALKPVYDSYISSSFGNRRHPIYRRQHFHRGLDLAAKRGTSIIAPADGEITSAGKNGGYGLMVAIDHKYGFKTRYGHLNKLYVRKGQRVKRGEKIGEVGNTGLSTSSHLHYEVLYKGKHINPAQYFFDDFKFNE